MLRSWSNFSMHVCRRRSPAALCPALTLRGDVGVGSTVGGEEGRLRGVARHRPSSRCRTASPCLWILALAGVLFEEPPERRLSGGSEAGVRVPDDLLVGSAGCTAARPGRVNPLRASTPSTDDFAVATVGVVDVVTRRAKTFARAAGAHAHLGSGEPAYVEPNARHALSMSYKHCPGSRKWAPDYPYREPRGLRGPQGPRGSVDHRRGCAALTLPNVR